MAIVSFEDREERIGLGGVCVRKLYCVIYGYGIVVTDLRWRLHLGLRSRLVGRPPLPLFRRHQGFRRSGRDPAPVSSNISFFYRITPDVSPTYLRPSLRPLL